MSEASCSSIPADGSSSVTVNYYDAQYLGSMSEASCSSIPADGPSSVTEAMSQTSSPIPDFYRGRAVLVTGATGFMGKVLVEKLLRSCPDVATIYLLMRPKRGRDVRTRLDELLNVTLFDGLRKDRPDALNKLVPIAGDITQPELGISSSDQKILADSVSVVFHSAATVKFDEKLKLSVSMNVEGTKRLVELCHKMVKLEALVHVSTAYCNCDRTDIHEQVYPPPSDPDKLLQCVDWMDEELLDTITPKIVGQRPNTYTYTKAVAEQVLVSHGGNLPIAIVRPSIVTAAWREPLPGWVDNLNGPTGMIAGAGKGILRTVLCYRGMKADVVPVDVAINLLITVAWHTATNRPNNIVVYNCTSGATNPVRWGDIEQFGSQYILEHPFNDVLWYPGGSFKSSRLMNSVCVVAFHTIPAYVIDLASRLVGKKPIMVRIQDKLQRALHCLEYFTTHEWNFSNNNVHLLMAQMHPRDKEIFNFDIKNLDWRKYFETYVLGTRKYILKEDPSSFPAARKQLRKMFWVHHATQLLVVVLLFRLLLLRSDTARQMCYALVGMAVRLTQYLWPA